MLRIVIGTLAAAATLSAALSAQAATNKVGETQTCVPLVQMDETVVIDDKTILMKMKGKNYKRVDLISRCPGLKISQGFSHATSTNDFCITDPLRVLEPVGATCLIDKIVNIDKDEAKTLLAKR